jgi:UDPglucose 6-dehydrogenase
MREAPSLVLIDKILEAGGHVKAYDPVATHEAQRIVGDKITFCTDPYDAIDAADALLIITEWSEFKLPDFDKISQSLNHQVIFDGRNIYDFKEMKELGFDYFCVGLKTN